MCLIASRGGGHLEEALPCTQRKEEEFRPEISASKDTTGFHYPTKGKTVVKIYS